MTETTYNGWANYQTWNASLYINNEYDIYQVAREWVEDRRQDGLEIYYDTFQHTLTELFGVSTPDGVRWNDRRIDCAEMSEMLEELV